MDFYQDGAVTGNVELRWPGGRGSFIVNGTTYTSVELQAKFDNLADYQSLDAALLIGPNVSAVVNFELPANTLVKAVIVGDTTLEHVAIRPITEVGAT